MTAPASADGPQVRRLRAREALRVEGLAAGWGRTNLLQGLDLAVAPGDRLAVLGPNGAGKTTLFDSLAGRLAPRRGKVLLDGVDVTNAPLHRRALLGLGYVPQEATVFAELTVRDNLRTALRSPAARRAGAAPEHEHDALIDASLAQWSLEPLAQRRAGVLSGGERRRVEVARALLTRPALLLLDEPFAGLDPAGRAALRQGLAALPAGLAVLVTDHAAEDVLTVADRVLLLVDGQVAFEGPTASFRPGAPGFARYFGSGLRP